MGKNLKSIKSILRYRDESQTEEKNKNPHTIFTGTTTVFNPEIPNEELNPHMGLMGNGETVIIPEGARFEGSYDFELKELFIEENDKNQDLQDKNVIADVFRLCGLKVDGSNTALTATTNSDIQPTIKDVMELFGGGLMARCKGVGMNLKLNGSINSVIKGSVDYKGMVWGVPNDYKKDDVVWNYTATKDGNKDDLEAHIDTPDVTSEYRDKFLDRKTLTMTPKDTITLKYKDDDENNTEHTLCLRVKEFSLDYQNEVNPKESTKTCGDDGVSEEYRIYEIDNRKPIITLKAYKNQDYKDTLWRNFLKNDKFIDTKLSLSEEYLTITDTRCQIHQLSNADGEGEFMLEFSIKPLSHNGFTLTMGK